MKIGFVGLGKLGLPVALAIESRGHTVCGYDIDERVKGYLEDRKIPFREEGIQPLLDNHNVQWHDSVEDVVRDSELIFIPIQTPHHPDYEGVTPLGETRVDFDYTYLKAGVGSVAKVCADLKESRTIAVISTCLPGTFEREILPLLNEYTPYVYTPQFIAMGTVIEDYLHPEFNLIGVQDHESADLLEQFYATINDAPCVRTDVTTAEGIKTSYNTWITAKTVIANAWGELCERVGMNFDDIKKAWDLSTRRLISTRYMDAGMSDGGGCFPPGELVMTEYGPRPIETIQPGDRVLTKEGVLRPVVRLWEREYDGDLVGVKAQGLPVTWMTTDHPVYVKRDCRTRYANGRKRTDIFPRTEMHEVLAENLTTDHLVLWPIPQENFSRPEHATDDKWRPIQRLERKHYSGPVYNLWVDDIHSYVVGCGAVSNCHPRDNIALSWLAQEVEMSHDIWDDLMSAREDYEAWHAQVAIDAAREHGLPLVLLGTAFKPETDIETGSPAILVANILRMMGERFMHVNDMNPPLVACYFIATKNERYRDYEFPPGSVVLDPFGYIPDREGVTVRRLGRR